MNNQSKAMVVIVCLFAFCTVPVIGPLMGDVGDEIVKRVLGNSPEVQYENVKRRKDPRYLSKDGAEAPLKVSSRCCMDCGANWSFGEDRCETVSQGQSECFLKCTTK